MTIRVIHILGLILRMIIAPFKYAGKEKSERISGYKKAFNLYIK
jgi:hypothetical protein